MKRVVITGMGIYSCLGTTKESVKAALEAGKSGIVFRPERKAMGYRSALTGHVPRPDLKGVLDRRSRIMMPEQAEFAYMATREALEQAGVQPGDPDGPERGLIYGNDSSAQPVIEGIDILRTNKDAMMI